MLASCSIKPFPTRRSSDLAVGAEDAEDLSRIHVQAHIIHGDGGAVGLAQVGDLDDWCACHVYSTALMGMVRVMRWKASAARAMTTAHRPPRPGEIGRAHV